MFRKKKLKKLKFRVNNGIQSKLKVPGKWRLQPWRLR